MFFLHDLTHEITIHPTEFDSQIKAHVEEKLQKQVEGSYTGDYYTICVVRFHDISEGRIIPVNGSAEYTVWYQAIVWKPFIGETVEGIVNRTVHHGVFLSVGPVSVFISSTFLQGYSWVQDANPPQWEGEKGEVITEGTSLRIKIQQMRHAVNGIIPTGTASEDYLGVISHNPVSGAEGGGSYDVS